jgi:hypothetical protein
MQGKRPRAFTDSDANAVSRSLASSESPAVEGTSSKRSAFRVVTPGTSRIRQVANQEPEMLPVSQRLQFHQQSTLASESESADALGHHQLGAGIINTAASGSTTAAASKKRCATECGGDGDDDDDDADGHDRSHVAPPADFLAYRLFCQVFRAEFH